MKNIFLLIVTMAFTLGSWAQSTIRGIVFDGETEKPIPFVNIGIKALSKGTVSDFDGRYELVHDGSSAQVLFSAVGYEPASFEWQVLTRNGNIKLSPKDYYLATVEVSAKEWSEQDVIIGTPIEKKKRSVNFGSSQLGTAIGALLEIEKETYLKNANFMINHANGDSMHFRVNIHIVEDNVIGENILTENVIISQKQRKGLLTIDLTPYHIVVNSPVLLSLEWIRDDGDRGNQGISFRAQKSRRNDNFFLKHSSVSDYIKSSSLSNIMPKLELGFYFEGKQAK